MLVVARESLRIWPFHLFICFAFFAVFRIDLFIITLQLIQLFALFLKAMYINYLRSLACPYLPGSHIPSLADSAFAYKSF